MAGFSKFPCCLANLVIGLIFSMSAAAFAQTETPAAEAPAESPAIIEPQPEAEANPAETPPAAPSLQDLMTTAYEKTKAARTVDEYTEVITLCNEALAKKPNKVGVEYLNRLSAWALNRRGKEYSNQAAAADDAKQAAELETQALADFEESVKRDAKKWQAVHNRGVSYAMQGDYNKALADFNRTIQLNGKYSNAWFNRGEILYEQGKLEPAIADYTKAIELNPTDAAAYTSRAHARYQQKLFRSALEDYNKAVQLDPKNVVALTDRADIYANLGYWERSARDYRNAVTIDPKYGRAYLGAAWLMATCPDSSFRNADLAIESAKKAIELDGDSDYRYGDTLAAAQANAGKFAEAAETIKGAVEKAPQDQREKLLARQNLYGQKQPFREPQRTASDRGSVSR